MKKCNRCKSDKNLREFHKHPNTVDGLREQCKACCSEYYKAYYKRNKEHITNSSANWREKNPGKLIAGHLRRRYGLTTEQYNALYTKQRGCCAICDNYNEKLHVDHDHTTSKIRQLLCSDCNRAIGMFQENSSLLRSAAAYIEYHNKEFK